MLLIGLHARAAPPAGCWEFVLCASRARELRELCRMTVASYIMVMPDLGGEARGGEAWERAVTSVECGLWSLLLWFCGDTKKSP